VLLLAHGEPIVGGGKAALRAFLDDARKLASEQRLDILSWNLFHGRSLPPASRSLLDEFAARLAAWPWDVALLQEVPPWWPATLARRAGAEQRTALTSRNSLLAVRRLLAERRPELMKSNGGGCNAILARSAIAEHRAIRLRVRPERRVAQLVRLSDGTCLANYHASTRVPLAEHELARLSQLALDFADGAPLVLGGDLNLRRPQPGPAFAHVAERDVDHLFAHGLQAVSEQRLLDRSADIDSESVQLSDHLPLLVSLS
jgi:endonuclease/exonuclease/phosphatase family metal-dependent hydrolase